MTIHSSILLWRIPQTGQPGGLQSTGLHSQTQMSTNNSVHYSNKHMRACALSSFSRVRLCNPMDCSLPGSSMEFSRPKYWSGLPSPPPGGLPDPGIKTVSLTSPALAGRFFTSTTTTSWEAQIHEHMFVAELFTIAKRWKKPKYSLSDEWTSVVREFPPNKIKQRKKNGGRGGGRGNVQGNRCAVRQGSLLGSPPLLGRYPCRLSNTFALLSYSPSNLLIINVVS